MTKAIAYVRYSSAVQGSGDSIDRQTTPLEAFESRFGVKVGEVYTDEGVSSFRGDNIKKGRFSEILKKIEKNEIRDGDYLVIESIDRISRQALNRTATTLYGILEKGINIYTTSDERLYSINDKSRDLENYLMIGLIAKRANEESETKSKRRRSAWNKAKRLAEEGKVFSTSNNTPYGLRVVSGKFEVVEEEAKEIQFIIENLKYEGVTSTIRKLNEWSKRKWEGRHIGHFMKNQYIRGAYRAQRRENGKKVHERYIEDYYPKIVSDTAFYEAKEAMKRRETKKEYGNKSKGSLNIFKHCIKCAECGSTMIFLKNRNPRGVHYSYYSCKRRKELKQGCENQFFKAEFAIALFLSELEVRLRHKDDIDKKDKLVYQIMRAEEKQEDVEHLNEVKNEYDKKIAILKNLEKTAEELEDKAPTYLFKKMSEAESEIEELRKKLESIKTKRNEALDIYDFNELLEMLYTENGRLKINRFLKNNDIKIFCEYTKKGRTLEQSIYIKNDLYSLKARSFDLRNDQVLEKYEINNIAKYV